MAIELNDNIEVLAPKPSDPRNLTETNELYASVAAANLAIPITRRCLRLPVNLVDGEYWYRDGIEDTDLILKTDDTKAPINNPTFTGNVVVPDATSENEAVNLGQMNGKEDKTNKDINNGYCGLDSGGKVPLANLPTTLLKYIGVWNASTNTPTLTNPDTTKIGNVYNVSVAGTQFGIDFKLGDWLIYNDSGIPEKSDNSDDVVSVNGQTGVVTITKSDVGLGNVDNTSDANKPISTATQTALNNKLDVTGYLTIVSSSTPVTLTASSPRFIIVTGTSAQTINLPDVSTLSFGYEFQIINNNTINVVTVNSSGGNIIGTTLHSGMYCNFLCTSTTGTTASSWQQVYSGGALRTGTGKLTYNLNPIFTTPSYALNATFTAGTNAQGQGLITTDVVVATTTPNNPSGITLPITEQPNPIEPSSRHITVINKGTNPIYIYPQVGNSIDNLGVNQPYLLAVNGVMVFRSASSTQWYSQNTKDLNENNIYLSHDFITLNGTDFVTPSFVNSGTLEVSALNLTVNNIGILRLTSSTTANSGVAIRGQSTPIILKGNEVFAEIINPLAFTNTTHRAGLHNSTSSSEPSNGVYFEYNGSGAIALRAANGGARNTATTITTLSLNTWYKLRITVNATATSILGEVFNSSGVLIASQTVTTNIPTTARLLNICSITTNSGTTATALIDVDYISFKTTLTR